MSHRTNRELLDHTHNTSRFFVENPHVAWAALLATLVWGVYGYMHMPQRKDPDIPIRLGIASCSWPGATVEQMEQLVTRPIEETIAQNKTIHPPVAKTYGIRSITAPGQSSVTVQLAENVRDTREQFNDIGARLQDLNARLPKGAGPILFQSDFGDTTTLMLTVASPQADSVEIQLRAQEMRRAIEAERAKTPPSSLSPVSIVYAYPLSFFPSGTHEIADKFRRAAEEQGWLRSTAVVSGNGFIGVNGLTGASNDQVRAVLRDLVANKLPASPFGPDIWQPIVVRDTSRIADQLAGVAGAKYTYAQLDDFTNLLARSLLGVPQVSRVDRTGILPQRVTLEYSQERLAAYGFKPSDLGNLLAARNITASGGTVESGSQSLVIIPTGLYEDAQSIGDTIVGGTAGHTPVYLRDLVTISQSYRNPPQVLNYFTWFDEHGEAHRDRAVTMSVFMRSGEQIQSFGKGVNSTLEAARAWLPSDLIVEHTSDQPLQVEESVGFFMEALYEAIGLVIVISLIGFWDWRSALLMAISIPVTLAMTFGFASLLGIDLQQVSIATLIIALGLLVDDPVVANDAIKREMTEGLSRPDAAWIGPTRLATAIVFATVTNIVAYLPFLLMKGTTGDFIYSLPVVMTCALVASRLVSMTFIPLIGRYLLKAPPAISPAEMAERRSHGFYGWYRNMISLAIENRRTVLACSGFFLLAGAGLAFTLKTQFFPDDTQYWSYIDLWLPDGTPVAATNAAAQQAEAVVARVVADYEAHHGDRKAGEPNLLQSLTSFVGSGGPRFWSSVNPQQQQSNYAQIIVRVSRKEATPEIVGPMQDALSEELPGVVPIVHQLQTNPVEFPVEVRISSTSDVDPANEEADNRNLRRFADEAGAILRRLPGVAVQDSDWLNQPAEASLKIDPDKANLAGVTNQNVAEASQAATDGVALTTLRQGNKQIPVVARLRMDERASLSDIQNIYVSSSNGSKRIPLESIASIETNLADRRIRRQEHFRTIGVHAYPQKGVLSSEVLSEAMPALRELEKRLPSGYRMVIGGELAAQRDGFANLIMALLISVSAIYAALLLQFRNAIKPLVVFAAVPYGVIGALLALAITRTPFGFMAFLGIVSLIGVIVSHIIVLFDFIEEMHEKGEPLESALRDAGVERLRPVLITVGATIFALFPLAVHGGPLWRPLCYAQIGGLAVATVITLLLVPVLYSVAVLDLRVIQWTERSEELPLEAMGENIA
ncbi:MAG: efflux RND transporter permease subunit [Terracidiphilus sp.]|jgi:multidrug efflux pump subunit AcrB